MKIYRFYLVLCMVIGSITTSCSSSPKNTIARNDDGQEVEISRSTVDPISVTLNLDDGHTQSSPIGPEGGIISTEGQDGTKYTLAVPPGALAFTEDISLTPINSMEGIPLSGGLVGGVHFSPNGLEMAAPAKLTIQTQGAVETGEFEVVGLSYQGNGDELHLYPMVLDGSTISIQVYHFSGYGTGLGTASETNNMRNNHNPSASGDSMNNEAPNPNTSTEEEGIDFLQFHWTYTVEPLLKVAMGNEKHLYEALRVFEWWLGYMDLYKVRQYFTNAESNLVDQGYAMLATGVENAAVEAHKNCVSYNSPEEVVNIFHWVAFAEGQPEIITWLDLGALKKLAQKCASFELEFESEVTVDSSIYYKLSTGRIQLVPIFLENLVPGTPVEPTVYFQNVETLLQWEDAYHIAEEGECTGGIVELVNSNFTIESLEFELGAPSGLETIDLHYNPGIPKEEWKIDCGIGDPTEFTLYQWLEFFCEMRWSLNELDPAPLDCYVEDAPVELHALVDNWDIYGSGQIFAEQLYTSSFGGFSEITRITLYHTPQE